MKTATSVPITVLMSVYNGERWLAESIQSVLNQTFSDFEFIVVDDGSSDQTLDILEQFSRSDSRVRILTKVNSGLADSLNYGIAHSRGAWIARIDADDISEPRRLEKQVALTQSDSSLVLVGAGLVIIDEFGQMHRRHCYPVSHCSLVRRLARHGAFFPHSSAFFKKNALGQQQTYRVRIRRSQDRDLWLRLAEVGKITCVNEPLVRIRKHSGQVSHEESGKRQIFYSHVAMVSYWLRRLGFQDPVDCYSDSDFESFRVWISRSLNRNDVFETAQFLGGVKAQVSEADGIMKKMAFLTRTVLSRPDIFYCWASHKAIGSGLPKKIAKQWRQFS